MKCRNCRRVIEDNSIYCNWCGCKQIREEAEISVPRPRQLKSGKYTAQIMVHGSRVTVTKDSEQEYYAEARAIKAGLITASKQQRRYTLSSVMEKFIADNENVLSPATIRGYDSIMRNRFKPYVVRYIDAIPWQQMINEEAALVSPKTLKNSWVFVAVCLRSAGFEPPQVNLPMIPEHELPWLDYIEIQQLLSSVYSTSIELAVLLALHSLRLSELLALDREDVSGYIHVSKSVVFNRDSVLTFKGTAKTPKSIRDIPVLIPRLEAILPASGKLITMHPNSVRRAINAACVRAGVTPCGVHGLRRSFASLGYHLKWSERSIMAIGGWSNIQTVHNIYVKLSQKDVSADIERMKDFYGITNKPL